MAAVAAYDLTDLDEVLADLAQRSLRDYVPEAWKVLEPATPFIGNWHIDCICEHLEAQTRGELRRLIINIPPRHSKSRIVNVIWPTWEWLRAPGTRWLHASYAAQLATRDSVEARLVVQSVGMGATLRPDELAERGILERIGYRGVVRILTNQHLATCRVDRCKHWAHEGPWTLSADQNAKTKFINTQRGYRISTSVGGTATGEGGDRLVVDDPHKADETQSEVIRQSVLDWYDQTWTTRLNSPKKGTMTVIMQRLHEEDLTGHLLEKGGYHHLCLPAEYEPKHPFACPEHITVEVLSQPAPADAKTLTLAGDPRTEKGELLWPERLGPPEIEEKQTDLGSYGYSGQYQQLPTPSEGGIFKRVWWQFYPRDTDLTKAGFDRLYTTWDTALKEKTMNDYTVGIAWAAKGPDRYVLRVVRGHWNLPEAKTQVKQMHTWLKENVREDLTPRHYFENAAMGPDLMAAVRKLIAGVIPLTTDSLDKVARANAVTPIVESGNVYVPGAPNADMTGYDSTFTPAEIRDLIEECSSFPNGTHDDQVDAFVYGLNPSRWVVKKPGKVRTGGKTITGSRRGRAR